MSSLNITSYGHEVEVLNDNIRKYKSAVVHCLSDHFNMYQSQPQTPDEWATMEEEYELNSWYDVCQENHWHCIKWEQYINEAAIRYYRRFFRKRSHLF